MRINSLVENLPEGAEVLALPPEESHHLARVLRVQSGQEITLFDGRGAVAEAQVEQVAKNRVEVRVLRQWKEPPPAVQIELFQALPKPDRWDLILQKAVELGASAIHPMLTRHTQFQPTPKKEARWQKIISNAAQQCEVRWIPPLTKAQKLEAFLPSLAEYDLALMGSLEAGAKPLRDLLETPLPEKGARVAILIGPEGDFSPEELEGMADAGAIPVSFGTRILRTETAAIFALSALACKWM